jgi:hypothetical protein
LSDLHIEQVNIVYASETQKNSEFIATITARATDLLFEHEELLLEDRTAFTEHWRFVWEGDVWKLDGNKSLSLQSHKQRSEHWAVARDQAKWSQFPERLLILRGEDLQALGIDIEVKQQKRY